MDTGKKSFLFSLLLHAIVLILLIASFDFNEKLTVLKKSDQNTGVIAATVMNIPSKLTPHPQKMTPPKLAMSRPQPPRPVFPDPIKPVVPPKQQQTTQTEQPKQKAIAILDKKQQKREQDKIAKQMLADINKQRDHRKKQSQKALVSAFEKDLKQLTAKSMQRQIQEDARISSESTQQIRGEVNKYKALILQVISQNWIIPSTVDKKLVAHLLVRVAPGGMVLDVEVVKSSGDDSLDRSARAAVFKSSPLPVPEDAEAFKEFKQFVLKVKPENVLRSDSLVTGSA